MSGFMKLISLSQGALKKRKKKNLFIL